MDKNMIIIFSVLAVMVFAMLYSGYKGEARFNTMKLWSLLVALICGIICNFILLYNLLFLSTFVPNGLKDGRFGLMEGVSFGAIMLNVAAFSILLGVIISKLSRKKDTYHKKCNEIDETPVKGMFPVWFNKVAHFLSSCIVGYAFAIGFLSILKGTAFRDSGVFLTGSVITLAVLYSIAGITVFIQKR